MKKNTKKSSQKKESRFSAFFQEFKENLTEGAEALSNISADIMEEVKDKAEDLYEKGSGKFEQASGVVHDYIDRYNGQEEIKDLSKEKEDLNAVLGDTIFHEFKKNGTVSKRFLTTNKMTQLFKSIENVDKEILRIGRKLESTTTKDAKS